MFHKTLSLSDCDVKMEGESGRFVGYASTFGRADSYGDTIRKGAYEATLREFGNPKMYVQHDHKSLPIGRWIEVKEDGHGLWVKGEFTPGMSRADEAHAALRHGTVDGLSIGYVLKKDDFEEKAGARIIRNVSKLVEISIVSFPADAAARIDLTSVKSEEIDQLQSIRDFERFLRDAGGLSKGLTEALVSRAKIIFAQGDPVADEVDAKALRELNDVMGKFKMNIPLTIVR